MTQHCTTPRATEKDGSTACKICKSYKVIRCFQIFQATNESQTAAGFIGVFRIASAILSKSSLMRSQISQSPQFWASPSFRDANGCSMQEHARLWHLMAFDGIWRPARGQTSTYLLDLLWRIMWARCRCNTLLQAFESQLASQVQKSESDQIIIITWNLLIKCSHFRTGTFFSWARAGCCEERCLLKQLGSKQGGKFQCTAKADTSWNLHPPSPICVLPSLAALKLMQQPHLRMSEVQNIAQQTSTSVKNSLSLHRLLKEFSRAKGE